MSWKDATSDFACLVTSKSLEQYRKLPKKGKPKEKAEWTPMAAILQHNSDEESLKVVAMGTGSKCIGQSKMNKEGWILNDSHAEIIARREFVRYLLNQLQSAAQGSCSSVFVPTNIPSEDGCACGVEIADLTSIFSTKPGVSFHFFSTQVPCGDAAIFPQHTTDPCLLVTKSTNQSQGEPCRHYEYYTADGNTLHTKRRKLDSVTTPCSGCSIVAKTSPDVGLIQVMCESRPLSLDHESTSVVASRVLRGEVSPDRPPLLDDKTTVRLRSCSTDTKGVSADIHRTGAKCIVGGPQDTKAPGHAYHTLGVLRTKPGRGDPTLSMSCSDKILRWNVVGCQGALLSYFISHPIFFETFTVASRAFDRDAFSRAVFGRLKDSPYLHQTLHRPRIYQCVCHLESIKEDGMSSHPDRKLAPAAIGYCSEPLTHEVIVQGLKQGVNLKLPPDRISSISICKRRIFEDFLKLLEAIPSNKVPPTLRSWREQLQTYHSFKETNTSYNRAKSRFLLSCSMWLTNSANMEQLSK